MSGELAAHMQRRIHFHYHGRDQWCGPCELLRGGAPRNLVFERGQHLPALPSAQDWQQAIAWCLHECYGRDPRYQLYAVGSIVEDTKEIGRAEAPSSGRECSCMSTMNGDASVSSLEVAQTPARQRTPRRMAQPDRRRAATTSPDWPGAQRCVSSIVLRRRHQGCGDRSSKSARPG